MAFTGKFVQISSDKFDEYLESVGVAEERRKTLGGATFELDIKQNGNEFTIVASVGPKSKTVTFTVGKEFDEETVDGRTVKTLYTLDGNKLKQVQKYQGKESTVTRELVGDQLKVVLVGPGGVTSHRVYKKQ